jgi:hypothetical protein
MTMDLIDPAEGIRLNVLNAAQNLEQVSGRELNTQVVSAVAQTAQVQATLALVHAVRELTERLDPAGKQAQIDRVAKAEIIIRTLRAGQPSVDLIHEYESAYGTDLTR